MASRATSRIQLYWVHLDHPPRISYEERRQRAKEFLQYLAAQDLMNQISYVRVHTKGDVISIKCTNNLLLFLQQRDDIKKVVLPPEPSRTLQPKKP